MLSDPFADFPACLSRFLQDEVRPLLLQYPGPVQEALERWVDSHAEQHRRLKEWQDWRSDFVSRLPQMPRSTWHAHDRPAPGFTWCDSLIDPLTGERRPISGWLPPGLGPEAEPPVDMPLPPPTNRDLSADECVAALVAFHDAVRDPRERIGPDVDDEFTSVRYMSYAVLHWSVLSGPGSRGLTEADLDALRAMLRVATAGLQKTVSQTPSTAQDQYGSENSTSPVTGAGVGEIDKPIQKVRSTRDPNQPGRDRQNDILTAITEKDMPLTRPEIIDAMKLKSEGKLGHHLAWMVANKILLNLPQRGYWPAGRPLPK
jgi:hypothetical protein